MAQSAPAGHTVRLVACDLDGTFLDEQAEPRREAVNWIRWLDRQGIPTVFATGRSWRTAAQIQARVGTTGPLVAHNGAYAFERRGAREWYRRVVPRSVAREMFAWADAHQVMLRSYLGVGRPVLFNRFTPEHLRHWLRPEDRVVPNLGRVLEEDPLELFLFGDDTVDAFLQAFGSQGPGYECTVFDHQRYREINVCAPGVDKLEGLQAVCRALAVPAEAVLAIGDGQNDVAMLKWAGIGVAVGHGAQEALAAADVITPIHHPDPVAWTIRHLFRPSPAAAANPSA